MVGPIARIILNDTLAAFEESREAFPKDRVKSSFRRSVTRSRRSRNGKVRQGHLCRLACFRSKPVRLKTRRIDHDGNIEARAGLTGPDNETSQERMNRLGLKGTLLSGIFVPILIAFLVIAGLLFVMWSIGQHF